MALGVSLAFLASGHVARAAAYAAPFSGAATFERECPNALGLDGTANASSAAAPTGVVSVSSQASVGLAPVGLLLPSPMDTFCGPGVSAAGASGVVRQVVPLTGVAPGQVFTVTVTMTVDPGASATGFHSGPTVPNLSAASSSIRAGLRLAWVPDGCCFDEVGPPGDKSVTVKQTGGGPQLTAVSITHTVTATTADGTLILEAGLWSDALVQGSGNAQASASGTVTGFTVTP